MKKKSRMIIMLVGVIVLVSAVGLTYNLKGNPQNSIPNLQVSDESNTLTIRVDTGNLDAKNITEEELHSLDDNFLSFLKELNGVEDASPLIVEPIAASKDENYNPFEETINYNVVSNGKYEGTQVVDSFVPTNYLMDFMKTDFEKSNKLIDGEYPKVDGNIFEVLVSENYQRQENVNTGDTMTLFALTINGLIKKEVTISGVYKSEQDVEYTYEQELDAIYTGLENAKSLTFFNDSSYDYVKLIITEGMNKKEIINEIKMSSGIRPEILLIEEI